VEEKVRKSLVSFKNVNIFNKGAVVRKSLGPMLRPFESVDAALNQIARTVVWSRCHERARISKDGQEEYK
jgi:hypothetical protein